MPEVNGAFSKQLPFLQLSVDSTSLGAFKTCPRLYFYRHLENWVPRELSPHLTFGLLMHQGREVYEAERAKSQDHEEALEKTLHWAFRETWNPVLKRPWISGHETKNRKGLIQTLCWYLDEVAREDSVPTIELGNGKLALELSFEFSAGMMASTGEAFKFCGHLDRIGEIDGQRYIVDIKTTYNALSPNWFAGFSPDNQFSLYALAGQVAFSTEVKGVLLDGIQVGVTFARFQRGIVHRSQGQLEEWLDGAQVWLKEMDDSANRALYHQIHTEQIEKAYPMNDKSCHQYGGCTFRDVCSRPPEDRARFLQANFRKEVWDPTQKRGDF